MRRPRRPRREKDADNPLILWNAAPNLRVVHVHSDPFVLIQRHVIFPRQIPQVFESYPVVAHVLRDRVQCGLQVGRKCHGVNEEDRFYYVQRPAEVVGVTGWRQRHVSDAQFNCGENQGDHFLVPGVFIQQKSEDRVPIGVWSCWRKKKVKFCEIYKFLTIPFDSSIILAIAFAIRLEISSRARKVIRTLLR